MAVRQHLPDATPEELSAAQARMPMLAQAPQSQGFDWKQALPMALMGMSGGGLFGQGGNTQSQAEMFKLMLLNQQQQRQNRNLTNAAQVTGALDELIGKGDYEGASGLHQQLLGSGMLGPEGAKALIPYGEQIAKARAAQALASKTATLLKDVDPYAAALASQGADVKTALEVGKHIRSSGDWQEVKDAEGNVFAVNKADPAKRLMMFRGFGAPMEPGKPYASRDLTGGLNYTVPPSTLNAQDAGVRESVQALGVNPNDFNRLAVSSDPADQDKYRDVLRQATLRKELLQRNPAVTTDMLGEANRLGIPLDPVQGFYGLSGPQSSAILNAVDQRQIRKTVATEVAKYNAMLELPITKALPDLKGKIVMDRTTFQRVPADKITGQSYLGNENLVALSPDDAERVTYATNAIPSLDRLKTLSTQLKQSTAGQVGATLGQALKLTFRDKTGIDSAVAAFQQDAYKLTLELGRIYGGSSRVPVSIANMLKDVESPKLSESLENTLTKVATIEAEITNQRNGRIGLPLVPMPAPIGKAQTITTSGGIQVPRSVLGR